MSVHVPLMELEPWTGGPTARDHALGLIQPKADSLIGRCIAVADLKHMDGAERETHIDKDGFEVSLDVRHFLPKEISVKTVNNTILIEAKHDERLDEHGHISRHFTRRYDLPKGFEAHNVTSQLSSDGILTLKAPPTVAEGTVRHVHIQMTGPADLTVKK